MLIISSLESSIKGSLLSMNSGTVGSLSSLERSSVLVVSSSEGSGGIGLGGTRSRCGSGSLGSVGIVVSDGGTVEMLGLGNIVGLSLSEGSLIKVIGKTLVAPFTTTVILGLLLEKDGGGVGEEES